MDQKDLSLYLEEQRTELMSLNKGIDQLSNLVQKQIDTYQPPVSDVKVEGNVKVNTEKAVEVTNLEELQKWLGNLGETVTEAIETNKPEQVTEITVKNIADAQQPDIKVTNFKELSKFFDQLNDNIATNPKYMINSISIITSYIVNTLKVSIMLNYNIIDTIYMHKLIIFIGTINRMYNNLDVL